MCNQGRTKSSKLKSVYSYLMDFSWSILLFLKSSVDRCPYLHVCVYRLYSRSIFSFSFWRQPNGLNSFVCNHYRNVCHLFCGSCFDKQSSSSCFFFVFGCLYALRWKWCLWCFSEFISTPGQLKNMPDQDGNRTYDLFGMLAQCSASWATRPGRFEYVIFWNWRFRYQCNLKS